MDGVGSESEWKTVYARYKVNPWDVIFFFLEKGEDFYYFVY